MPQFRGDGTRPKIRCPSVMDVRKADGSLVAVAPTQAVDTELLPNENPCTGVGFGFDFPNEFNFEGWASNENAATEVGTTGVQNASVDFVDVDVIPSNENVAFADADIRVDEPNGNVDFVDMGAEAGAPKEKPDLGAVFGFVGAVGVSCKNVRSPGAGVFSIKEIFG